jgi:hypothetical protein
MKPFLWLGLLLPVIVFSAESMKKRAVLFLPDQIECRSGEAARLTGEIGFRWDEDEPLYLSLWANSKSGKSDLVFGSLTVFDEKGRELSQVIHVTLPPSPDDGIVVKKGEVKRFGLYELFPAVIFPRPGNYYAVASFSYGISGKKSVDFTTNKRWFKVVEASPDKNSL